MSLGDVMAGVLWIGITFYVLLGLADFGAGLWDLLAGGAQRGHSQRQLIEHVLGPVWETNHTWLIFVLVILWTGFPSVFGSIMSTLYVPLTLAALGIIGRGAAFAFRKTSDELWMQRLFGATFAASSVVTPFFFGAVIGAVASGRVPLGVGAGNLFSSWATPTSVITGILAIGVAAYLAAVYLTREAQREGEFELAEGFRRRGLLTGVIVGILAAMGLVTLHNDAPRLFDDLTTGVPLLLVVVSVLAGLVSMALLVRRAYVAVRLTAAATVTALLAAWGVAQYPDLLPGAPVADVSAQNSVIIASLLALAIGGIVLIPSMLLLYSLFQKSDIQPHAQANVPVARHPS